MSKNCMPVKIDIKLKKKMLQTLLADSVNHCPAERFLSFEKHCRS